MLCIAGKSGQRREGPDAKIRANAAADATKLFACAESAGAASSGW